MVEPLLSIIIVTHNSRHEIDPCLASLATGCGDLPHEVIVVDSASTDGTADHLAANWPAVDLIALGNNRGFAYANNQALARASGRCFLLLNPDTIVQPGAILALFRRLEEAPEVGVVGPRLLNGDGTLQSSCREFPRLANNLIGMTELYRLPGFLKFLRHRYPSLSDHDRLQPVDWVVGACLLVRAPVVEIVGPLNDQFFMYVEEMEWQYRIRQQGWQIWFEPAAEVVHLGGASSTSYPVQRIIWQYASLFHFYRLHYSNGQRWLLKLLIWLVTLPKLAVLAVLSLARRQKHPLLAAFWNILWIS